MRRLRSFTALVLAMGMVGCASQPPLKSAASIDLPGYMGRWYVIGYTPNVFERGKVATADEYRLQPDGKIAVTYHYRKSFQTPEKTWTGRAWVPDPADAARWKMQLLWPFRSDYIIVEQSDDQRAVLVGLPSRKLLWIMSRQPTLDEAEYRRLLQVAATQGFAVDQVRKVPQLASQQGQPGFQ